MVRTSEQEVFIDRRKLWESLNRIEAIRYDGPRSRIRHFDHERSGRFGGFDPEA